jgi:hypothetical protein
VSTSARESSAGSIDRSAKRRVGSLLAFFALALCALGSGAPAALAAPPTATIDPASEVGVTSAKAKGKVTPEGAETGFRFDYISDAAYSVHQSEEQRLTVSATAGTYTLTFAGQTTTPLAPNASAATLQSALEALSSIGAGNIAVTGGPGDGAGTTPYTLTFGGTLADSNVEQLSSDPALLTGGSQSANPETTLEGRAEGFEGAAQVGFGGTPTEPEGPAEPEATLEGLAPATTYHLRLVAESGDGSAVAVAPNFTTDAATVPTLAIDPPSEVKYTSAHIDATLDPEGGNTNPIEGTLPIGWEVQVSREGGEWEGLVFGTIEGSEATATTPIAIPADLTGLQNGATFKVRLRALYAGGIEALSPEEEFKTETVSPPLVLADDASLITATSAHFSGKVTPGNADPAFNATTCAFDYVPLARSEHQRLRVQASGGAFKLSFEGQETPQLPFNASAAEVAGALQALSTVGPGGVSVAGGGGIHPYLIGFGGLLANKNVPEIEAITKVNIPSSATPVSILTGTAAVTTSLQGSDGDFASAVAAPCDIEPIGTDPVEVKADATGLEPHTTYRLRLRAENQGGPGTDVAADFTTEAVAPAILETAVREVGQTSAILQAEINPGGDPTTYHFEYLTAAAYNNASGSFAGATPTPESGSIGAGNEGQAADAPISGLQPNAEYRYRVVATNSKSAPGGTAGPVRSFTTTATSVAEGESCPNRAVREQQGSTYLPECRAYELVNSPSASLGDSNRVAQISEDGEYAATMTPVPGDEALGGGTNAISVSHRTPTGWVSTPADPTSVGPSSGTGITGPRIFTPDFSRLLVSSSLPSSIDDLDDATDIFRVEVGQTTTTRMTIEDNRFVGEVFGATPNLDRIVYHYYGLQDGGDALFAGDGVNPPERLSVFPDGSAVPSAGALHAGAAYQRGLGEGLGRDRDTQPWVERGGNHGVSDDTLRVYFYNAFSSVGGFIYLRDLHATPPRTVLVSRSHRVGASPEEGERGFFISASHDGSSAFFASPLQLTDDASPGGGIYRFDLASDSLTLLTGDPGDPAGLGLGTDSRGSAIASDDQSHLYLTSTSALAGGAVPGDTNLYVWTQADGVRFISKVADGDRVTRVTPDGRFALLLSSASLGGAPNGGRRALYRYDYAADALACVSCRADGSPSLGDADIDAQSIGFPGGPITHGRALTFDGRVFFTSTDRLVARDQTAARDVYLYDNGSVSLLSSGSETTDSFVAENTDDGKTVFIYTRASLVGADSDPQEFDVYAVRVGGGFLEPPPSAAPCAGEACRTDTSVTPSPAASTTPKFVGPANPKPCAKGKTRRNGRCVKSAKARKHRKKHAAKQRRHKRDANSTRRAGR